MAPRKQERLARVGITVVNFWHRIFARNLGWVLLEERPEASEIPMTSKNRPSAEKQNTPLEISRTGRKPYHKPEFRFEKTFETMALACLKKPGTSCAKNFMTKKS